MPAESVYAVLEVKQEASKENLVYAGDKVASVRRLDRTSAPIINAGQRAAPRDLTPILGGFLALESGWKPQLGPSFESALLALEDDSAVDLGCVLQHGAFEVAQGTEGERIVNVSKQATSLISFFLTLLASLQGIGTVAAINIAEYARALTVEPPSD